MQKEVKKEELKKVVNERKESITNTRPGLKDKGRIGGTVLWDNFESGKMKAGLKK